MWARKGARATGKFVSGILAVLLRVPIRKTSKLLMKVLFDTKKVQKLGRISLSEQLLRNAGLQEGDAVNVYFDATTKCIVLERADKVAAAFKAEGYRAPKTKGKA
jgi:hypothetical protein